MFLLAFLINFDRFEGFAFLRKEVSIDPSASPVSQARLNSAEFTKYISLCGTCKDRH